MMAHSLSPDSCRRLASHGPCAAILAAKGAESVYLRDCLVRQYQAVPWSRLQAELSLESEVQEVWLEAGIGTLVLRPGGTQFFPSLPPAAVPQAVTQSDRSGELGLPPVAEEPRAAPAAVVTARLRICAACPRWMERRCTVAGCAWAGLGQPANRFSRCPEGRW